MPENPFDVNAPGGQRGRTLQEALADAHGRELNRLQATDPDARSKLPFGAFVDQQRRAFEEAGDAENAKRIKDFQQGKQIALGEQRQEDALLATGEAAGRVGSGLGLIAEKFSPFADGGVSREERLENATEGSTFARDSERLLAQAAMGFADAASLGAADALTQSLIKSRIESGDLPTFGDEGSPLAGMDANTILRRGELAAETDLDESGVPRVLRNIFRGAGELGAFFTGTAYLSRAGNMLKATRGAIPGLRLLGRAVQNPIINMAAYAGLESEGNIAFAKLQGEDERAVALREEQFAKIANAAAFGAFGQGAAFVGNVAQRGLLRLLTPGLRGGAARAKWFGKSISDLPSMYAKGVTALTHVGNKAAEFAVFSAVPTPYSHNPDGSTELSPWLTTILNPIKISEQLSGENNEWVDAVGTIAEHAADMWHEEAGKGVLIGLMTMGKAKAGAKFKESFHNPFKLGPTGSTDAKEQQEAEIRFQREVQAAAGRALSPQERAALRDGVRTEWASVKDKPEQMQAIINYVIAGSEAQARLQKKHGLIDPKTPTVVDAFRRHLEEQIGPEIFTGREKDATSPSTGVEGELVADPDQPNQPGRRFEVLSSNDATPRGNVTEGEAGPNQPTTRILRVRYEDGTIGVIPASAARLSTELAGNRATREAAEAEAAKSDAGNVQPAAGQGERAAEQGKEGTFGPVRDTTTGDTGELVRRYTNDQGRELVDVQIGGEIRTFDADRFEAAEAPAPTKRLAEEDLGTVPGRLEDVPTTDTRAQEVAQGGAKSESILAGARRMAQKGAVGLFNRLKARFGVNNHEALHLVEAEAQRGAVEGTELEAHQNAVIDAYYAPDQRVQRGRGGNPIAGYRALRKRFLAGRGNVGPRKTLGRLKATWDSLSDQQREAALANVEGSQRFPHEEAGRGLDLVQRRTEGVDNRFLKAEPTPKARKPLPIPKSKGPESPPKPEKPKADEAPAPEAEAPEAAGSAQEAPTQRRRVTDTGPVPGETPDQRRIRRLKGVAAGRKAQATTDKLTGLANTAARRKATPRVDEAEGQGWLFLDGKGIKEINNQGGQEAGDAAIRSLADKVREMAQEAGLSDRLVFREGGDEFVVGGDRAALDAVRKLAEADGRFHVPEAGDTFSAAAERLTEVVGKGANAPEAPDKPRGGIPTRAPVKEAEAPAEAPAAEPEAAEAPKAVERTPGFDPDKAKAFQRAGIARIIARAEKGRLNSADLEAALEVAVNAEQIAEKRLADARSSGGSAGRAKTAHNTIKEGLRNLRNALKVQLAKEAGGKPEAPKSDVEVKPGVVVKPPEGSDAALDVAQTPPADVTSSKASSKGRKADVVQADTDERVPARYATVPIESLLPSHDAGNAFKPNEAYPEGLQPRDYQNDQGEQLKVEKITRALNPSELINTNPRADAGPATVAWDAEAGKYVVLNGNGRTMGLIEALKDPATAEAYRSVLESQASIYGIDADAAKSGGILVRVADLGPRGAKAKEFARRGNIPSGLRQKPVDRAAAEVGLLSDSVLTELSADADTTVSQAVNGPKGAAFRASLRKKLGDSGNDLFTKEGALTDTGREFVDTMLSIKAGFSKADIEALTPSMRRTVAASTMQFLQLERNAETKDVAKLVRDTLGFIAKDLQGGKVSLEEFLEQGEMFDQRGPETMEQRAAVVGLSRLANKPRLMRNALAELVRADKDAPGQGTFLDTAPPPLLERLSDAFGLEVSGEAITIAQDARVAEEVGFPSLYDTVRHDELTHSERETMGAPDPIDTTDKAPVGGLRLPISERPEGDWSGATASRRDIVTAIEQLFEVPIRVGRSRSFNGGALGWFNVVTRGIRLKNTNDIVVASHEAGHSLERVVWPQMRIHAEFDNMRKEMEVAGEALYGVKEPSNGYASEGFAEFMRLYITRPSLAKSSLPKTFKWFEQNFAPDNKTFKARLDTIRQMTSDFVKQGDENRILSSVIKGKLTPSKFQKALGFFSKDKWWDELSPIERLVTFHQRKGGPALEPSQDPFKVADTLRNTHNARAEFMAEVGMIDPAGRIVGPALADSMGIIDQSAKRRNITSDQARDQFGAYLIGKRTLELHARGIRSGNLDLRDARSFTERMELENPEYLIAGKQVWDWNRSILTYMRQLGAISPADYNAVLKRNRFYVPYARVHPSEVPGSGKGPGGSSTKRNALQRIGGSDADIRDPFPVMVSNAAAMLRFSHRRAVMQRIADLARPGSDVRGEGMASMIQKVDRDVLKKVKPLEDFKKQLEDAGADLSDADMNQLLTWYEPKTMPDSKSPIVPVVNDKGKVEWFEVERSLWDALEGMDPYRLPGAFDLFLGAPARLKRLGTTGLRASFSLVTNPLRDFGTMMFQSQSNNPAEIAAEWAKAQGGSLKHFFGKGAQYSDLWEGVREGKFTMEEAAGQAQKRQGVSGFVRAGGVEISQPLGQDLARTFRLGEHLGKSRAGRVKADLKKGRVIAAGADLLDLMRDVFQIPEMGPRIAEANIIAKKIGWKPGEPISFRQAMNAQVLMQRGASQVTVDFNAAGRYARIVNAAVPFFNVAIQGPRSFLRAYKRNPMAASAIGMGVTAMTLALWKQNRDEEWYKDMPWREKFAFWHIRVGDERIRIPRPFEPGLTFAVLPEATMDSMYREDPRTVKEALDHAFETLKPDFLPVVFQEAKEQFENEDEHRGSPIVPLGEGRLPAEEQAGSSTSIAARKLGQLMGWSPRRIDHAINGIFGGVGTDLARAGGVVQDRGRDRQLSDTPVLGRLFAHDGAEGYSSQAVQDFFALRKNLQERGASQANPASPREKAALRILERASRKLKRLRVKRVDEKGRAGRNEGLRQMRETALQAMERAQDLLAQDTK